MKIAISGGKGGTGKSTISTNLAVLFKNFALVDLDVEAPNDHILLGLELKDGIPVNQFKPVFNYELCTGCGLCKEACNDSAIIMNREGRPVLIEDLCTGCRACYLICPVSGAIEEGFKTVGYIYHAETPFGFDLVSGSLIEGEERTYRVVLETKRYALSRFDDVIVDTAAGAGNAVYKSVEGADLVVAVTEPTSFGARDLKKILEITSLANVKTVIVVNKSGIGSESQIEELSKEFGAPIIGRVSYSEEVMRSYFEGVPVVLKDVPEAEVFLQIKERIEEVLRCR